MSDSRKQYERKEILIRSEQVAQVQADADDRYPELGARVMKRNFSPAMRDILDFWWAHYALFSPWIVSRNNQPPQTRGGTE